MIPKIIHYCWFGKNEKTDLIKKCIRSWEEKLPDYKIMEWNEDNYNVNWCRYSAEAYQARKYAFVADVARFYVLQQYGGIYLDTDVEVLKNLDDFLDKRFFTGFENENRINPGLIMGSEKGFWFLEEMLCLYKELRFALTGNRYNIQTICTYVTDKLVPYGFQTINRYQCVKEMHFFPTEYFCPLDYETGALHMTDSTYSIHYYAESWKNKRDLCITRIGRKLKKIFGVKVYDHLVRIKHKIYG